MFYYCKFEQSYVMLCTFRILSNQSPRSSPRSHIQGQIRAPAQGQAQGPEPIGARPAKGAVGAESRLPNRTPPRGAENPPVPSVQRRSPYTGTMTVPHIGNFVNICLQQTIFMEKL